MEIRLPKRFEKKMGEDLCAECKSVYIKYAQFATPQMYFFPEYTDHSYKHIQYVLETANNIIPNDTFEYLTSNDIFVLCLSVLYHDLGMHMTFKSLKSLWKLNPRDDLLEKDFIELWKEYIEKKQLVGALSNLEELEEKAVEKYEDIFADFLRMHHPVIADIIAREGFPLFDSNDNEDVARYEEKSKDFFYQMSGIVARSHGEDLRVMTSYIQKRYGLIWKTPYDCHIVYLMCIVRIADYLHITDDRINPYRLNLWEFHNDKSKMEYLKHKSVEYSQRIYGNSEAIYIEANPMDCRICIELMDLLKSIQYELDTSWAVLGEVYGTSAFKLSIRRVTSNILEKEWQQNANYVPEKMKFHFDIRLVDLLIEPLYGNSASYGIRELIQNATDACKTRQALFHEKEYEPRVNIVIGCRNGGEKKKYLQVIDNGIGMGVNVIKNHFLNIGSRFRNSTEWKNLGNDKGEQTEPLEKNGKFGVGILSSYLLGDILKVKTCSIIEKEMYEFEIKRDTQLIEIKKDKQRTAGGTTIEIDLKDDIDINTLVLDEWYLSNDIEVCVDIFGEKKDRKGVIDLQESDEEKKWNKLPLESPGLEVYWSYNYKIPVMNLQGRNDCSLTTYSPNLVCNGIVIPKRYDEKNKNSIVRVWPTVYVIDKDGKLDLNLSRDEVNGNLPFIGKLEEVLLEKFIQEYEKFGKQSNFWSGKNPVLSRFDRENYYNQKIMFGKKGYVLLNLFFLDRLEKDSVDKKMRFNKNGSIDLFALAGVKSDIKVVRVWTRGKIGITLNDMMDDDTYYIFEGEGSHPDLKKQIVGFLKEMPFSDASIYMSQDEYDRYQEYPSNLEKLSQKFISEDKIKCFEPDRCTVENSLYLNLKTRDVALAIVYSMYHIKRTNDGSEILEQYYGPEKEVLQSYGEL